MTIIVLKVKFDLIKTLSLISDLILTLSSLDLYFFNSLICKEPSGLVIFCDF